MNTAKCECLKCAAVADFQEVTDFSCTNLNYIRGRVRMSLSNIKVNDSTITGVDNEPILGSDNLVKSGGVAFESFLLDGISRQSPVNGMVAKDNTFQLDNGHHKAIPVNDGDIIDLVQQSSYLIQVFWCKNYTIPSLISTVPDFCVGHEARESLTSGTYTAPSDCKYMVVGYDTLIGGDFINIFPSKIIINGIEDNNLPQFTALLSSKISEAKELARQASVSTVSELYGIRSKCIIGYYIGENNTFIEYDSAYCSVICVRGGERFICIGTGNESYNIAICKNLPDAIKAGASPEYATDESGRRLDNQPINMILPEDAKYIVVRADLGDGSGNITAFKIDGKNYAEPIRNVLTIEETFQKNPLLSYHYGIDGFIFNATVTPGNIFNSVGDSQFNIAVIPILGNSSIKIVPNIQYATLVSFVKTFNNGIVSGEVPDWCDNEVRRTINTETTLVAPADANFLIVNIKTSGTNIRPISLEINGYDVIKSLVDNVNILINQRIQGNISLDIR